MKKAFKNFWCYINGFILYLIPMAIAFIPRLLVFYAVSDINWPSSYPSYVLLFSAFAYLLIGFIWQDLKRARERHKTKNWDKALPEEFLYKCWRIFAPFIIAAVLCAITGGISNIFQF